MKKNKSAFIVMFSHCILVKGTKHSVIQDNQRERIVRIPNAIYDYLNSFNRKSIGNSLSLYEECVVDEIISYLLEEEFIFLTDDISQFPLRNDVFESSEIINNCIIEYDDSLIDYYDKVAEDFIQLGCKHLELRFGDISNFDKIKLLITSFSNTRLLSIDLYLKYNNDNIVENMLEIFSSKGVVNSIVIHSVPKEKHQRNRHFGDDSNFVITQQVINYTLCCGIISQRAFSINSESYLLSKNFNNCLYKKIAITTDGSIKLCPSMKETLGNIKSDSFFSISQSSVSNEHSEITKDKVDICKVCEFRYACSDCRAFLEDPNNIYSKPLKCGYDPYEGEWQNWKKNPNKETVLKYYNLEEH